MLDQPLCGCGRPISHKGACKFRLANDPRFAGFFKRNHNRGQRRRPVLQDRPAASPERRVEFDAARRVLLDAWCGDADGIDWDKHRAACDHLRMLLGPGPEPGDEAPLD